MLATVIGASLSAMSSNSIGDEKGVTIATAITGGILLLFGARLAAGCTRCVCARIVYPRLYRMLTHTGVLLVRQVYYTLVSNRRRVLVFVS